ncbi:MAG: ATP-binding cassette domain-containing protein [Firmicutes bacterium]|nr:ATP-binding cassette domain-containing protein [Bacillota bacterium]
MLKLRNLTKIYKETPPVTALDNVSLSFGQTGLVSIIGKSGSGKTSLLNIIGGLDGYNSGVLEINGICTVDYSARDWNAYRAKHVGFVFQKDTTIHHLTTVENVMLSLQVLGKKNEESMHLAREALGIVGLAEHEHKVVTHLSAGEIQRVEIARAIVKNPSIVLADEPTGNLDEETADEIMRILREVSKKRLVIMVTHNKTFAEKYSDRVVELKKGKVIGDRQLRQERKPVKQFEPLTKPDRVPGIGFVSTFSLAVRHMSSKKFITAMVAFSTALGIAALSILLALQAGFGYYLDTVRKDNLNMPVLISATPTSFNLVTGTYMPSAGSANFNSHRISVIDFNQPTARFERLIPQSFQAQLENGDLNTEYYNAMLFTRALEFNLLVRETPTFVSQWQGSELGFQEIFNMDAVQYHYDLIHGEWPQQANEILLVVDEFNRINLSSVRPFGFTANSVNDFDDLIQDMRFVWIGNDDYFVQDVTGNFIRAFDDGDPVLDSFYNSVGITGDFFDIDVVGIIRKNNYTNVNIFAPGFAYLRELANDVIFVNAQSDVVLEQIARIDQTDFHSVLDNSPISMAQGQTILSMLGFNNSAIMIHIFANGFDGIRGIENFVENFNYQSWDFVFLTDPSQALGDIINGIISVLAIFSVIALSIATIMLGIIVWTTVRERAIEIAILRSLGTGRTRVTFLVILEYLMIGLVAALVGITIGLILLWPVGVIIERAAGLGLLLITWQNTLLVLGLGLAVGLVTSILPALITSRQDVAKVLRDE